MDGSRLWLGFATALFLLLGALLLFITIVTKGRIMRKNGMSLTASKVNSSTVNMTWVTQQLPIEWTPIIYSTKTIPFLVPPSLSRPFRSEPRLSGDDESHTIASSEDNNLSPAISTSTSALTSGNISPDSRPAPTTTLNTSPSRAHRRGYQELGTIDPSLYRTQDDDDNYIAGPDHLGRIWFSVEYEQDTEKLNVTLIRIRHLRSRMPGSTNACDPFVRLYLMPDERRYLQSKQKRKTCNPKYDEQFVFQISAKGFEDRSLRLTVYDVDRNKRQHVTGHAQYSLKEHCYDSHERVVIWRDLEREYAESGLEKGQLHLSLQYNPDIDRLTVGVFEGKKFKSLDGMVAGEIYVKIALMHQSKVVKTKKSEIVRRTSNPTFNESFCFKVASSNLDICSATITAMQHFTGQKDRCLGRVTLGSFMFARGRELEHWNEMLANQKSQISKWHTVS